MGEHAITAIEVFDRGATVRRPRAVSGEIAKVWGLGGVRIGDEIGERRGRAGEHHFAPPTLETVVVPDEGRRRARRSCSAARSVPPSFTPSSSSC
ncbi:MAG: hypothetical protein ACRDZN_13605, partial [Acidimicrobiales bacterium]